MPVSLIIAAGGKGLRFQKGLAATKASYSGSGKSKLYHPFLGRPLLISTIERFQKIPEIRETIVAVPAGSESFIRNWSRQAGWHDVKVVRGGKTRAESVLKGLEKSDRRNHWIMVHDGARPLVSEKAVNKLVRMSGRPGFQAGILAKKVIPTIKQRKKNSLSVEKTIDRNLLFEAETPQVAARELLRKAYRQAPNPLTVSDEAGLLEAMGIKVHLCTHEDWNPKITTFEDLKLAEAYMKNGTHNQVKVGLGRDTHRLVLGRKLLLGGIRIPFEKGALGHSDGDVVLHAVSDAIWGVLGQGDIGEHFSDRDKKFKNIQSKVILKKALEDAKKRGWYPAHVDTVITLEKPKLGNFKKMIKSNLARLMKLENDDVSVKAKTLEGLGPEGLGLAISCEALVTMKRESR